MQHRELVDNVRRRHRHHRMKLAASGTSSRRDIPKGHPYDPKALKPMSKAMWAATVSLGHALTAYRHFSRLKSATISPDGMIGGRGYAMAVQEVRQRLYQACEALSAISDTLYDEISAPHWKPKLALLEEGEAKDIQRFVQESRENLDHPEEQADERRDQNDNGGSDVPRTAKLASNDLAALRGQNGRTCVDGARVLASTIEGREFGNYDYRVDCAKVRGRNSSSTIPDADHEPTETDANDFGLGYGANGRGSSRASDRGRRSGLPG